MSLMRYLIQNGLIYDGTLERPPFRGDILVEGERITAIDSRISCEDAQVFDAGGRMVTPGFIDFHRHADLAVFSPEFGALELAQGITTVGMGVCGFSFAPYTEKSDGLYSYTLSTHGPDCTGALHLHGGLPERSARPLLTGERIHPAGPGRHPAGREGI